MADAIYELHDVSKSRLDNRSGKQHQVLYEITARVRAGELVTLIGPSGAGKSTLLWMLNRLEDADSGQVSFMGKGITEWNVQELRRRAGLVFQQPVMLSGTVEENILYGPHLSKPERDVDAGKYLDQVGLPREMLSRSAQELSGGEQQRVSLARTLANAPEVLLLDEVTSSLDPESAQVIEQLIMDLNNSGMTIFWVTHDLDQARRLNGESWVLVDGHLVESTPTERVFAGECQPITEAFVKGKLRENGGTKGYLRVPQPSDEVSTRIKPQETDGKGGCSNE